MPALTPPKSSKFPPVPEFYGQEPGPQISPPASNWSDWSKSYQQSVSPHKDLLDTLMEIANDPRNAWIGLGPMAGAALGSRLIKPLVAAEQSGYNLFKPAKAKALKWSGSEGAAKILDYDPALGQTTHPYYSRTTTENFPIAPGGSPPTPDEIIAAQNILKQMAQQNAPQMTTLYRGGDPIKPWGTTPLNPQTPIPVTSDIKTATEFTMGKKQPLFELQVPREDLLANIEKLQRGRGYQESEYLVPLRAFQNAQTRIPFENPTSHAGTKFEGAKIEPLHAGYQTPENVQQPIKYGNAPMGFELSPHSTQATDLYTSTTIPGNIYHFKDVGGYLVSVPAAKTSMIPAQTWNEAIDKLHAMHAQLKTKPLVPEP